MEWLTEHTGVMTEGWMEGVTDRRIGERSDRKTDESMEKIADKRIDGGL